MAKRKKAPAPPKPEARDPEDAESAPLQVNVFLKQIRVRISGSRGMKRFATLCGLPYTTYRNYEMGRNRIPFRAAKAIGAATGENPFAIVAGGEEAPEAPARPPEGARARELLLHARGRVDLESFSPREMTRERKPVPVSAEEFGKGDDFLKGGNRFVLVARGRSMAPSILEGDLLVFARGAKAGPGDVVCASLGGEMTVRRHFPDPSKKLVTLQSDGGTGAPKVLREGKPEAKRFKVEGVLISLRRSFGKPK
ncbi:MAG: S24 family peptidase [Planctomycetes bacterium]|jgi:hypothetical protein|nr:S24 family peptidase [Planctomycetota bacterium]